MKTFVVAFINFFDNQIEQHKVEASDWQSALEKAKPGYVQNVAHCSNMEKAMEEAYNQDWGFHVLQISD